MTIAIAAPAGNYENTIQLDRQFNMIMGVGFVEISGGGLANLYDVGAKSSRQNWLDPINTLFWTANGNVGPMQKYYSVKIPYVSGDTWYFQVVTGAAVAGVNFVAQMVLFLAKDTTQLPLS